MATIEAVCTSHKKGIAKRAQASIELKKAWEIKGDCHSINYNSNQFS